MAFFAGSAMGSPTCEEQSDPVYGGCSQYADDGYEATTEQKVAQFGYYLTLLYIPVILGAIKGRKENIVNENKQKQA